MSALATGSICLVIVTHAVHAVESPPPSVAPNGIIAFESGEELFYDVTFLSLRLGTIRIKTDGVSTVDGRRVWHAFCYADSREGIPFVSLHVVYESFIDELGGYSTAFVASDKMKDGNWMYTKYNFRYPERLITIETGTGNQKWSGSDISTPTKYCDGLALYFYARRNAMNKKMSSIPTLIQSDTARTIISFLGERVSQEIDAVNYPVDCNHFVGTANWTGVYGLTGRFEGWFSNDRASIPIKARMNLLVGSVWIELSRWTRSCSWMPPKAS